QAEDGIRDFHVTGVQTCALPILVSVHTEDHERTLTVRLEGGRLAARYLVRSGLPRVVGVHRHQRGEDSHRITSMWERGAGQSPRSEERRVGKERGGEMAAYTSTR